MPEENIVGFLKSLGKKAETVEYLKWKPLTKDIRILSIPLYNDDSLLLIDTPNAFIINQNDSKPQQSQWKLLKSFLDKYCPASKKRILLSSYSPASPVNSFLRNTERVSMKEKKDYVKYVCVNCQFLGIDYFMPFASQAIFYRSDSDWANSFKVTYDDLAANWTAKARLLPPYSTIDLQSLVCSFKPVSDYNHSPEEYIRKARVYEEKDKEAVINDTDLEKLRKKMNRNSALFCMLFPKGFSFDLGNSFIYYNPWTRKIIQSPEKKLGHFCLVIPRQALKDVLEFDHFGDLGITMFTLIILNKSTSPKMVYVFFMLVTMQDYKHTDSLKNFRSWMSQNLAV
ncbi:MAG: hypothetical protein EOO04_27900 [Chitinophagaceae bacterium]|nr:MAG: hypothetical protein EOO04_27900 [Chitinophagaceae bacterium]